MKRFLPSALLLLLAACTSDTATAPSGPAYSTEPPLEIGGERPAKVVLPENYSISRRYPLVVLLHGYGANAGTQDIIFGLKQRIDEHGFILVLPEGTRNSIGRQFWNATPVCCNFDNAGVDDVAYLSGLVDEALQVYAVDPERVNFVGHSNGGYMSYRLACEVPGKLHRIAVLAGSVFLDEADCESDEPVSVLHMHGTADNVVPYAENFTAPEPGQLRVRTVGAEAAIERWTDKAGCASLSPVETADLLSSRDGKETEVLRGEGCAEGVAIEFWKLNDGDHVFLDANDEFRDRIVTFLVGSAEGQ